MNHIRVGLTGLTLLLAGTAALANDMSTAASRNTTLGRACYVNNKPVPCSQQVTVAQKANAYRLGLDDAAVNTPNTDLYKSSVDYKAGFDTGLALWGDSPLSPRTRARRRS